MVALYQGIYNNNNNILLLSVMGKKNPANQKFTNVIHHAKQKQDKTKKKLKNNFFLFLSVGFAGGGN